MPKRTFQPKKRRRVKRLGFMARMKVKSGRTIKSRRKKGRKSLSASDEVRSDKRKKFSRLK